MCLCCDRIWTGLHVLWAVVYVCAGAVQIVTGIFFLISLPALRLCSNVWAGSWNVVAGIGGGMLACFGETSPRRQERLLYVSVSILVANTVNAVLTEWTFYSTALLDQQANRTAGNLHTLITYARVTAGIAAATVLLASFLDSQLTFCSIDATRASQRAKARKVPGSHEQVSDIEYIIPRPKSSSQSRPANSSAYSQSWVFEAENSNSNNAASPYLKLPQDSDSPIGNGNGNGKDTSSESVKIASEETIIIANPVVHIEEASDESNSNSDRKLCYMKSFSRSTSPAVLSAASSQISLDNNPPIYECLEKLTEPSVYRSRLNTALSVKEEDAPQFTASSPKKPEVSSPRASDQVQYASLMMELEQALSKKDKTHTILSPDTQTNSNSSRQDESSSKSESHRTDFKSSDADFSKELEAALQLIQDLESPNTVETPSETCGQRPLAVWRNSDASGSEKTLSAVGSLAELTSPMTECLPDLRRPSLNGKLPSIVVQCSDSQSTSGYSSPTRKWAPNWSANSSIDGSSADLRKNFAIKNINSTAVISLFGPDQNGPQGNKSVTIIKLNNDDVANNNVDDKSTDKTLVRRSSSGGGNLAPWNVKSLLRKKKPIPRLSAELESAIIKSESLAHLTDLELLARHERNREIQRQIEQRVQQQLGQMTESNC